MTDITIRDRIQHAWNAFQDRDQWQTPSMNRGVSSSYRPDRPRIMSQNERSIITSIYNRIAIDVAAISLQHVQTDADNRYIKTINSGLNNCLTLKANIDQTARAFIQDVVLSMFDEGCVALVPIETTLSPKLTGGYDITKLRTGKIMQWYPEHVQVRVYNELRGMKEDITLPKSMVTIIENPFYAVMNEPNSTFQRLILKLNLLDSIDQQSGSGKLDLIIQLPYVIKTQARRDQAEDRRKDIEMQLAGSKFGIAYTDGSERITQLNRPIENKLMEQITYLTSMLFSQLGMDSSIFDGTADAKTMLNYHNRTVEPVVSSIVDGMKSTFLTKTARTQFQTIMAFRDPFKLVPVADLAEIADKFTRNEILSSNEFRGIIGFKPSKDPTADELRNKNLNAPDPNAVPGQNQNEGAVEDEDSKSPMLQKLKLQ